MPKITKALNEIISSNTSIPTYAQSFIDNINKIIENLKSSSYSEKLKEIIPKPGDRVPFLILNPNNTKLTIVSSKGTKEFADRKDKGFMLAQLRILFTDDEIYELLDYQYYFNQLATSLCNYLAIEYDPGIADYLSEEYQLQNPNMTEKEIKEAMDKRIKKAIDIIKKPIINRYYPKRTITDLKKVGYLNKKKFKINDISDITYNRINEIVKTFKGINVLNQFYYDTSDLKWNVENKALSTSKMIQTQQSNLNIISTKALYLLQSEKSIPFNPEYLDSISELIYLYELISAKLSKTLISKSTRNTNRKLKVFIWKDKEMKYKTKNDRYLYKFEIKLSGNKNLKNKNVHTFNIPEFILRYGGVANYSGTLKDIIKNYCNYFESSIEFVSDGFTLEKDDDYIFNSILSMLKMLEHSD